MTFQQESIEHFGFHVQVFVGTDDGTEVADTFAFDGCSPSWIVPDPFLRSIMSGKGSIIQNEFDLTEIKDFLSELAEKCAGNEWVDVARQLATYSRWEFERNTPCSENSN